jgi:mannose-6-phosphate isomerase-like protein (cupin superfamily)
VESSPESLELLGFRVTFHSQPNSSIALMEWEAPPEAGGIPVHVHEHTEEGFYVLRGELALWADDTLVVRGPGSYTVVRPGQRHSFWNPADRPAAYLTPISPAGVGDYLRELAVGLAAAQSEAETAALRIRLAERYDVTVVGPPPQR